MAEIMDDVMDNLSIIDPGPTASKPQIAEAFGALEDARLGFAQGITTVVDQVYDAEERDEEYAVGYSYAARLLRRTQRAFREPDPSVLQCAEELEDLVRNMQGPLSLQAPPGRNESVSSTVAQAGTPPGAPEGEKVKRPSLTLFQSGQSDFRSTQQVPTTDGLITIGSGQEAIDTFDVDHFQIPGVKSLKVMHPLTQANLAKCQTTLLERLGRKLGQRLPTGRYSSGQHEAVKTSVSAILGELQRRGVDVSRLKTYLMQAALELVTPGPGTPKPMTPGAGAPTRGMSFRGSRPAPGRTPTGLVRLPSYGPPTPGGRGPSSGPMRTPSGFRLTPGPAMVPNGRETSLGPGWMPSGLRTPSNLGMRTPSFSAGGRTQTPIPSQVPDIFSDINELGSGDVFSEYVGLPNGQEMLVKHPITREDLEGADSSIMEFLRRYFESRNRGTSLTELQDPTVVRQYQARGKSLKALFAANDARQAAKDAVVANVSLDTPKVDNKACGFTSTADSAGPSTRAMEKLHIDLGPVQDADAVVDRAHAVEPEAQAYEGKGKTPIYRSGTAQTGIASASASACRPPVVHRPSALKTPGPSNGNRSSSRVAFHPDTPDPTARSQRPRQSSRGPSKLRQHQEKYGSRSSTPAAQPEEDKSKTGSDYFDIPTPNPASGRVKTSTGECENQYPTRGPRADPLQTEQHGTSSSIPGFLEPQSWAPTTDDYLSREPTAARPEGRAIVG
jgi:hypothetical protein